MTYRPRSHRTAGVWISSAFFPWYSPRAWWAVAARVVRGRNWCCGGLDADEWAHWEGCPRHRKGR